MCVCVCTALVLGFFASLIMFDNGITVSPISFSLTRTQTRPLPVRSLSPTWTQTRPLVLIIALNREYSELTLVKRSRSCCPGD